MARQSSCCWLFHTCYFDYGIDYQRCLLHTQDAACHYRGCNVRYFQQKQFRLSGNPIGTANTTSTTVFTNNTNIKSFKELIFFVNLKTLGRRFVYGCSYLTEIWIPSSVTVIGNHCFANTIRLVKVRFYPTTAPEARTDVFSSSQAQSMGYNTRAAGTNEFHVPFGATGYNTGQYSDPLKNTNRCGFTVIYDL